MKKEVALIIIYNHRYDKNIEVVEDLYKSKFSNIFHLVPFYDGDKSNVIAVYENAFYFQGYIAQGLKLFFNENFVHYLFIADDLLLNPGINENTYQNYFKLEDNKSFIPYFIKLHEIKTFWPRVKEAYNYKIKIRNIEAENELPTYDEALIKFEKFGLDIKELHFNQLWKPNFKSLKLIVKMFMYEKSNLIKFFTEIFFKQKYQLPYPLIGSYSDICIVSGMNIKRFCHLCGVFAATNLHVEVSLPTALVLSADEIITENKLTYKGKAFWPDGWNRLHGENDLAKDDFKELEKYNFNLKLLFEEFPKDYLYIHPIKLSKWKMKSL